MSKYVFLIILIFVLLMGCTTPTEDTKGPQLTVNKIGPGLGTVTSSPEGIACGNQCAKTFTKNIQVTLTAIPDKDATFQGWTGDCQGTASCAITMDAAKGVTASFGANPLNFNLPAQLPLATKDIPYVYSFVNTNPVGGNPPYKFVLATGVGFPPFGLTISTDKALAGIPTTVERRDFGVCVVDAQGHQKCRNTQLRVQPGEAPSRSGNWKGPFDMRSDISFFCSNLPILVHDGTIDADLIFDGSSLSGSAIVDGVKSIAIDGYGNCNPVPAPQFTGEVTGSVAGKDITLFINFGDPDLFIEQLELRGTITEGEITGDLIVEGASGTATLYYLK